MSAIDSGQSEARKARARSWFEQLRDDICARLEALEDALPADAPLGDRPPVALRARPGSAPITAARRAAAA